MHSILLTHAYDLNFPDISNLRNTTVMLMNTSQYEGQTKQ